MPVNGANNNTPAAGAGNPPQAGDGAIDKKGIEDKADARFKDQVWMMEFQDKQSARNLLLKTQSEIQASYNEVLKGIASKIGQ